MHVCLKSEIHVLLFWSSSPVGNQGLVCHICIVCTCTFLLECSLVWDQQELGPVISGDVHFGLLQNKSVESGHNCRCVCMGWGGEGYCSYMLDTLGGTLPSLF